MIRTTTLHNKANTEHIPKVKEIISLLNNLPAGEAVAVMATVEYYLDNFAITKTDNIDEFIKAIYSNGD